MKWICQLSTSEWLPPTIISTIPLLVSSLLIIRFNQCLFFLMFVYFNLGSLFPPLSLPLPLSLSFFSLSLFRFSPSCRALQYVTEREDKVKRVDWNPLFCLWVRGTPNTAQRRFTPETTCHQSASQDAECKVSLLSCCACACVCIMYLCCVVFAWCILCVHCPCIFALCVLCFCLGLMIHTSKRIFCCKLISLVSKCQLSFRATRRRYWKRYISLNPNPVHTNTCREIPVKSALFTYTV